MKQLTLTQYRDIMRGDWFVYYEDNGSMFNAGVMMTGYDMLEAIDFSDSWDETNVCKEDACITAKDLLLTLCNLFDIETEEPETYDDVYYNLYQLIENVTN